MNTPPSLLDDIQRLAQQFGIKADARDTQQAKMGDIADQVITLHIDDPIETRLMTNVLTTLMGSLQLSSLAAKLRVSREPVAGSKTARKLIVRIPEHEAYKYAQLVKALASALEDNQRTAKQVRDAVAWARDDLSKLPGTPYPDVILEFDDGHVDRPRVVARVENMAIEFAEGCGRIHPSLRCEHGTYDKTNPSAVAIPMDSPHVPAVRDLAGKSIGAGSPRR